jgi:RHS repeat-associated protein
MTNKCGITYSYNDLNHPSAVTNRSDGKTYSYDANGNMLTGAGKTFTWDIENRLDIISVPGIGTTSFDYDYTGMRVLKNAPTGITTFPFQGYEVDPNSVITKFIRIGIETFASKKGTTKYFYHNDHLGGVNVITDINGAQVQLNEYDPWGKVSKSTGNVDPTHRFTGKELDPESGLYYYGGRYYDPELARFVSADPFVPQPSDPQSLNRYSYVLNNPVNLIDPDGHFFWAIAAIAKAIVSAVQAVTAVIGTIIKAASAALNAAIIGGTEGAVATITVKHALLFAGGVRIAADLMRGSSRGSSGSAIQDGGFSSPMFAMAGGADCKVCPISGFDFLRILLEKTLDGLRIGEAEAGDKEPVIIPRFRLPKGGVGKPQRHHAISKPVHNALERHQKLRGHYQHRDPRFTAMADSYECHHGCQAWHRFLDMNMAEQIRTHLEWTPSDFERYLHEVYNTREMRARFPGGLEPDPKIR